MSETASLTDTKPRSRRRLLGIGTAITFVLAACSSDSKNTWGTLPSTINISNGTFLPAETTALPPSTKVCARSPAPATHEGITITFDDLDPVYDADIRVYPGVKNTKEDRDCNGAFAPGTIVTAKCVVLEDGRFVPPVGAADPNSDRGSKVWFQIEGDPGVTQYATKTFADISAQDQAALQPCPTPIP